MKKLKDNLFSILAFLALGSVLFISCQRQVDELANELQTDAQAETLDLSEFEREMEVDMTELSGYISWERGTFYVASEDEEMVRAHMGIRENASGELEVETATQGWLTLSTTRFTRSAQKTADGELPIVEPKPGDTRVILHSACKDTFPEASWECKNRKAAPWSTGGWASTVKCKADPDISTACVETFVLIGSHTIYMSPDCVTPKEVREIYGWACEVIGD